MAKKKIVKTNAIRMVEQKKIPYTEHEYEWDENHLSASSVAEQLPESQSRIFKTLVAVGNVTGPLVAVIPVLTVLRSGMWQKNWNVFIIVR